MILNKQDLIMKFLYFILFISFLHTILRLSDTSSISLFRVLIPIGLFLMLFLSKNIMIKFLLLISFILYNFIAASLYCQCYIETSIMLIHTVIIFTLYLILKFISDKRSPENMLSFMMKSMYIILFVAILELIFKFNLPNVSIYNDGSVSSFFWTQNELSTAMIGMVPFILVYSKKKVKYTLLPFLIFLTYFNDSKTALMAILIAIVINQLLNFKVQLLSMLKILIYISIVYITIILILLIDINNEFIAFRDISYSLDSLLLLPIESIITLTEFPGVGSIPARVNSAIFGIRELINSNFFGIGLGNSIVMLGKSEYYLYGAQSMHNLPLQLIVELGFIAIIFYLYIFIKIIKISFQKNINNVEKLYIIAFFSYPIGVLSSSVGIFSNYYFILSFMLIFFMKNNKKVQND